MIHEELQSVNKPCATKITHKTTDLDGDPAES